MAITGTLTVEEIVDLVIGFLAVESHLQPGELRAELEAAGSGLPVNSLLVVEVLSKVEAACEIRLPVTKEVAASTRSVLAFAEAIHRELAKRGDQQDGG
jgi:hypothetical protein